MGSDMRLISGYQLQRIFNVINAPRDFPQKFLPDQLVTLSDLKMIPNEVMQTWETARVPRRLHKAIAVFRNLNKDSSFRLFTADQRDRYMTENWRGQKIEEIYRRALFGPLRADIFRYCYIFEHGGWYFDISKGATIPLSQLTPNEAGGVITFEGNLMPESMTPPPAAEGALLRPRNRVAQWGFGFAPRSELLHMHIRGIETRFHVYEHLRPGSVKDAILEYTGPIAFTKSLWDYFEQYPDNTLHQVEIDLEGSSIYSLRGAGARYWTSKPYGSVSSQPLFSNAHD